MIGKKKMNNIIYYGRKRNGIKSELTKKINDWLKSIKDVKVRELAYKDVIVTGGAIASMLLGEKVNDFDLYFRTKSTTIAVAKYYVKQFNKVNDLKGKLGAVPYEPTVIEDQIENCKGEIENRVIIFMKSAGVAGENQKDYRYFENLSETATINFVNSTAKKIRKTKGKYKPVFMTDNAITLTGKIQLVIRFYGEPNEIHANYDFVHATCYWDHANKKLELPAKALECLLSRTLIYNGSLYPVASIFRTKKFIERGWRITAGQQLKMIFQVSELNLNDFHVLREQLIGVDVAYMFQLIEAVKEMSSKGEKIDATYLAALIDKIFD